MAGELDQASEAYLEADARAREALKVYRPLQHGLPFHESRATFRVIQGGNRSSKTTHAAAEFAAAVTRRPIVASDGRKLPYKYPKRPLRAWVIGYDQRHIGQTIYSELFEGGKYSVLPVLDADGTPRFDENLQPVYETFQPWNPEHVAREEECKPVGPLIPERLIEGGYEKGITWENKGGKVFDSVKLTNGTTIYAYSSTAKAKQGDAVDLIWIDEDIEYPEHVAEWEQRLSDKKGRIFWSAFPHSNNDALLKVTQRAEQQEGRENPDVFRVKLSFLDNPFIDPEEKRKRVEGLDEMSAKARIYGDFLFDTAQIYDFKPSVHGVHSERSEKGSDPLSDLYAERRELPKEWTRYLSIDPGYNTTAALVGTVPPPSLWGKLLIVEKELVLPRLSYEELAREIFQGVGHWQFEAFVMDMHMGRQTHTGQAEAVWEGFARAFKAVGLASYRTRHEFEPGCDNVKHRREATRERFRNGSLRVCLDATPHFQQEIRKYRMKIQRHELTDTVVGREHDVMDALEYLVAENPVYVEPRPQPSGHRDEVKAFLASLERRDKARSGSTYLAAS